MTGLKALIKDDFPVIPVHTGIYKYKKYWTPAFPAFAGHAAGVTYLCGDYKMRPIKMQMKLFET